jgi:hypothetical protein
MERELTEGEHRIFTHFPVLFRAVYSPDEYRCPLGSWGLEIGPGWYALVEEAASRIEPELHAMLDAVPRERLLVAADAWAMEHLSIPATGAAPKPLLPYAFQVKEKFGGLLIHLANGQLSEQHPECWNRIIAAVRDVEQRSAQICEGCGRPGKLRKSGGGWRTSCAICEKLRSA